MYSYHDAWRWALQTAKALQYMHKSSPCVIHRDLKADNLLLTMAGRAGDIRVMDFGLAKLCGACAAFFKLIFEFFYLSSKTCA